MAKKNATPTEEQSRIIRKCGLSPALWAVVADLQHTMIIKHRISGEFKVIEK